MADGKVTISTALDNKGLEKGVSQIKGSLGGLQGVLGKLSAAIRAAFSVQRLVQFGKESVAAAAELSSALAGLLQQLAGNFYSLKVAVGNAIGPLLQALLPAVNAAVAALTRLANAVATVMAAIFGKAAVQGGALAQENTAVADSALAGADAEEALADSTAAAGKAATSALAGFDELNVLQSSAGSGGGSGGAASAGTGVTAPIAVQAEVQDTLSPQLQAIVDKVEELLEPLKAIDFTPAVAAFDRLKEAISPLTKKLFEGLEWAWYNLFVPLAAWTIEDALPAFLDLLSGSLDLLNSVLEDLRPLGEWLWKDFLLPLGQWAGGAFIAALGQMTDLLHDLADLLSGEISFGEFLADLSAAQSLLLGIAAAFGAISAISAGMKAFDAVAAFVKDINNCTAVGFIGKLGKVIARVASGADTLAESVNTVFGPGSVLAGVAGLVGGAVLAFTNFFSMLQNGFDWAKEALMVLGIALAAVSAVILGAPALVAGIVAAVVAAAATVVVVVKEHWGEICSFFAGIGEWLGATVIQPVAEFFGNLWDSVLQLAASCWEGIKAFFTPAVEWFSELLGSIWQTFSDIFYNLGVIAAGCWAIICAAWGLVASWFDETVIQPVAGFFSTLWGDISAWAAGCWGSVCAVFAQVAEWFGQNVVQPVSGFFQKLLADISGWAADVWANICTVFGDMVSFFKGLLNGVIGTLNAALGWIFGGVNQILGSLKGMSVLGMSPFAGLRAIAVPQIPYLAQGAVIPPNRAFLAVLGDQSSGANIEAPAGLIRQMVAEGIAQAMAQLGGGEEINITFTGDLAQLGRVLHPVIEREGRRKGTTLAKGALA